MHAIPRSDLGYAGRNTPLNEFGALLGGADVQCVKSTRSQIDDIAELIESADALANLVCQIVPGIIGHTKESCAGKGIDDSPNYGVITSMAARARDVRAAVLAAHDELSRLGREFKV